MKHALLLFRHACEKYLLPPVGFLFHKLRAIFRQLIDGIGDAFAAQIAGWAKTAERRRLNDIFQARDKGFFKKKRPVSESYPFSPVDPFDVFGEENLHGDYYLVGDEWLNKDSNKPVAVLWGFNDWKWGFVSDYLPEYRTAFAPRKAFQLWSLIVAIRRFPIKPSAFIFWGYTEPWWLRRYAQIRGIRIYRMEDGFIRSSMLGAAHSTPYSLILDSTGLYYNPETASDLEEILNNHEFTEKELASAKTCLDLLINLALSKYNPPCIDAGDGMGIKTRKRVAIIGQVDKDMSVKLGNPDGWSMVELIRLAKLENPTAEIFYRPHPEIYLGYQKSRFRKRAVEKICKLASPDTPLIEFLDTVDHVYVITSLAGMEALLRGKKVTVVGAPFYAGWGLTDDRLELPRRTTKRTLLELFAGVYLKYPRYLASITDGEIGFKAACLRIKADINVATYDLVNKSASSLAVNAEVIAKSDYWPWLFFGMPPGSEMDIANQQLAKINFGKLLIDGGRLYQSTLIYSMCGKIQNEAARNIFITKVRKYIDVDILNELLVTLDGFQAGSHIATQIAWLLTERKDNDASLDVLLHQLDLISTENDESHVINSQDGLTHVGVAPVVPDKRTLASISDEQSGLLLHLLDGYIRIKKFDEAIKIANVLLLGGGGTVLHVMLKLAKIAELKFDTCSARAIALFTQNININFENRKAVSIALQNIPTTPPEAMKVELMLELATEIKLNPERINTSFMFGRTYLNDSSLSSVIEAMLNLDNRNSIAKAMAYLEVGQTEHSIKIIEHLARNGETSDKLKVIYSRALSALGKYERAVQIMAIAREQEETELNFRESLRLMTYLGKFDAALRIVEEAKRKKIDVSDTVHIPVYLGLGEIEAGYKCYLEIPFREELINYFKPKYKTTESLDTNNLLILSAYGPGDEVRFASLYQDFFDAFSSNGFRLTCDYRLAELFSRSFPEIDFVPIKRTRGYSPQYPRELFDQLPGSDLCPVLDNHGLNAVKQADEVILVTDLIWQFRKTYASFPGRAYLKHDEAKANEYASKLPKGKKLVGINWRSSLTTFSRNEHYLSVEELEPIFRIEGVQYLNFQYDECQEELDWIEARYPGKVMNIADIDQYNDLDSVAALMKCMDLMIAPATSVAELAGALGCRTWLFSNSSELNWRKIDSNFTDVWHHSMTLVEGAVLGDKKTLVRELASKLTVFVNN
jgi:capsular polysaccharide export protein